MSMRLDEILDSRRWRLRCYPFKHLWVESAFGHGQYQEMVEEYRGLQSSDPVRGFRRDMPGYDAAEYSFRPGYRGAFDPVLSRALHTALARILGVGVTGDVNAALHYHAPGGASGHIHNDLNPGWFVGPIRDELNLSDSARCSYRHGTSVEPGIDKVERVRAVAVIFYLNNGPWTPGCGGETGLYIDRTCPVAEPVAFVPPISNSLLAFECSPISYHAYIASRTPRSSLSLWLHQSKEDAVARWGEQAIVYWPKDLTK